MNRKDFAELATILHATGKRKSVDPLTWALMVDSIARALEQSHAHFNKTLFLKACGRIS